jgi:cytoskeletal protein RodZ
MEEQVKANPRGDQAKEVEKEVFVETPKSNKLTYILIGLGALLVLAVGVLGFVVYKQAMTNPPSSTNTSSVNSSTVTTSSSTSSSVSTSSNTASVSVSSAISSKYYKYNTNNGKQMASEYQIKIRNNK